ncbi:TPA: DUF2971 domain-containing protein [Vibrio harveyi]|nr:DUF2971 domain-containing protein [Vibrio harveyi]
MSIDKFIDLLSNKRLFLTPLAYYQSTDPFEGFVPKVVFEATMKIFLEKIEEAEAASNQIEQLLFERFSSPTEEQFKAIERIKAMSKSHRESLIPLNNKISKSTCVHCWYHSESESEAMWKLYSDSGKGIAIKTSVASLVDSLNMCDPQVPLRLGRVKYLDFLSEDLTPKDCLIDGTTSPLLKRKEYEHENEVRLYSVPQLKTAERWESYEPEPILVQVDISTLIEKVYISPFVGEPFNSSVWKICELFDISKEKVINSQLLENYEKMLSGFVKV